MLQETSEKTGELENSDAKAQSQGRHEDANVSEEIKETEAGVRPSQAQVEQSAKFMFELQADGTQLVTDVMVTADARETKRRLELEKARRKRMKKLEDESTSSLGKCEEITSKWSAAKAKKLPQDLRDALNSQQQLCENMIEDKDRLIKELQQELKASDVRYVKNLKRNAAMVDLMIKRMNEQFESLTKCCKEQLVLIENSFHSERQDLLMGNKKKWEEQGEKMSAGELSYLKMMMKQVEEFEIQMQKIRQEGIEEYKKIKKELELELQLREQQLQDMKAVCFLNQEKLEYNLQVLKKREEENIITKSQQKRKITRHQDILNNLKIKCANHEKQTRVENKAMTDSYKRALQQYQDTQKKMRHFSSVNAKRFEDLWLMNEAEAKAFVHKALEANRLIHEQVMGMTWNPPPLPFMDQSGPIQPQRHTADASLHVDAQAVKKEEKDGGEVCEDSSEVAVDQKTVKRLLELLCDETGFLIESRLLTLLSPLEKDEQSNIKLASIFSALGLEEEEDVYRMTSFFVKYKQEHLDHLNEDTSVQDLKERPDELIHPNDVLQVLRAFTAQFCRKRFHGRGESCDLSSISVPVQRDDSEDAAYWDSMVQVIPQSELKVWNELEPALENYHTVLTKRSKLLSETAQMQQQNTELRLLLKQYLSAKVNIELVIPPTQITQLTPQ